MPDAFHEIRNKADRVREINLEAVLKLCGAFRDKSDKRKWHTCQGVISVSGPKFMNWNRCIGGGGAIDLAIHLHDLDFKAAVLWLSEMFPTAGNQWTAERKNALKRAFQPPVKDDKRLARVIDYLVHKRCLHPSLLGFLVHAGKLYADTRGNAVFLLLGKEKKVVGAELRGTTRVPWRGMAPGSRKDLGCFYVYRSKTKKMVLCESAIDAISCFALDPDCLTASTSGANPNPAWLKSFINDGYEIHCGFDADETGDKLAKKMIALHPTIKRLRPSKQDWNEVLMANSRLLTR